MNVSKCWKGLTLTFISSRKENVEGTWKLERPGRGIITLLKNKIENHKRKGKRIMKTLKKGYSV